MEYPILNCRMDPTPVNESDRIHFTMTVTENNTVVDLSTKIVSVYDQGRIGSCTANALCSAVRCIDPTFNPSRLFLYYNCRHYDLIYEKDNSVRIDDGTTLRQGINVLKRMGVCNEISVPYIESRFAVKPSRKAYSEALNRQILNWKSLPQTLNDFKNCLASGYPFVFGILVYKSFFDSYIIKIPDNNDRLLGGHAMLCVGYDDDRRLFKFINSWGKSWGENGYGYIPYDYLLNRQLAWDFWVITNIERINIIKNIVRFKPIIVRRSVKSKSINMESIQPVDDTIPVTSMQSFIIWTPSQLGKRVKR